MSGVIFLPARWRGRGAGLAGVAVVAANIAPLPVAAQTQQQPAPARESECAGLPDRLAREGADWSRPARALRASPVADAAVGVALRERAVVTLAADARPIVLPRSAAAAAEGYGGFVAFRSAAAGPYRISLDERAWIEVVAQGSTRPAVATESDKRMRCFGVAKNLSFELSADTLYFVQLSGAGRPSVGLLISPPAD